MGERLALVIASQCDSLNRLSFLPKAAHEVAEALLDPEIGGCVPASGTGTLIDPTMVELDDALVDAFERASENEATLFLALVGHGDYAADDFYFLTRDAQYPPDSRKSYLLAQRIKELLSRYSLLDGLVILLDTCHAGIAAVQAAERWSRIVGAAGKRFEVLTASDDRTAANGCFSLSLAKILRSGDPSLGERLRCPDLKRVISGHCPAQTAVHLAFDGTWVTDKGDQGLWLARNTTEAWQPLRGNPAASEIDRLTDGYRPPGELGEVVGLMLGGARCVQVTSRGLEASALLAALARPAVASRVVPPNFLDAVLFVSPGQTVEELATELARQLSAALPGLETVTRPDLSAFEQAVLEPLRRIQATGPVRIAVNGLGTLTPFDFDRVAAALETLMTDPALGWVRLVVGTVDSRSWPSVPTVSLESTEHRPSVPLPPEDQDPLDDVPSPAYEVGAPGLPEKPDSGKPGVKWEPLGIELPKLLDLLAFTPEFGPLPVSVLLQAGVHEGSGPSRLGALHEALARVVSWVEVSGAGTPEERIGLKPGIRVKAKSDEIVPLLLKAFEDVTPTDPAAARYALANEAELCWKAGLRLEAIRSLENRPLTVPVENRERWGRWAAHLSQVRGRTDRLTIICQARHATWIGKAGDPAVASERFRELLPVAIRKLGRHDEETLSIRNNLGFQLWDLGEPEEARDAFRALVTDSSASLGPDHVETLHARHLLAVAEGKCGDGAEALRQFRELLPEAERALGDDHDVVRKILHNIIFWSDEIEHPPPGIQEHRRLLTLERARLGERHPDYLDVWFTYARALDRRGLRAEATEEIRRQLVIAVEVLGERHPHIAKLRAWG
ncbi:tetratricopeptide repeat protein [Amycolatopsis sp. NPDC059657]|uniref:tetratricopeptide repeat protein n=1 Tax=Amycolatopsis sp. NPDC059657 TaxID=3346899 RepID=UPI00366F49AA